MLALFDLILHSKVFKTLTKTMVDFRVTPTRDISAVTNLWLITAVIQGRECRLARMVR